MKEESKEHFRGVVWPRQSQNDTSDKPVYRYVIIGMLVTDSPIEGLHHNETVIDGTMVRYVREMGMAGAIEHAPKFAASRPLGDAESVLLSLDSIVGEPLELKRPRKTAKKTG